MDKIEMNMSNMQHRSYKFMGWEVGGGERKEQKKGMPSVFQPRRCQCQ